VEVKMKKENKKETKIKEQDHYDHKRMCDCDHGCGCC